ncbi:MAG: GTP-binding protein [Asgard group archaeon]
MATKVGTVSGFLGSGKTKTLIEVGKILDTEYGLKSAILMNDIGEAPVDVVLVDGYKFLDFVDTIEELIERQTQGVEYIMINKMDLVDDQEKLGKIKDIVHRINPDAEIREMSAKFGEGIREIVDIIMKESLGVFELKDEGGSLDIDA